MTFLFEIPNAMLSSVWILSMLFIIYNVFKIVFKLSPSNSFILSVFIEIIGTIFFIADLMHSGNSSFKLTSIQITNYPTWFNFIPLISVLYFIAILIYSIYLLIEMKQLAYLRHSANFENNHYWNKELSKYGLTTFQIGHSNKIQSPITFGFLDAVVLLPFSILNHLSLEEVKLILLHEVAHIIRNDFMIQLIIKICHTILLFNPFSYFFINEINKQRELACDDWVIKQFGNPVEYSKSLYQLALVASTEKSPLLLNAIGHHKALLNRIKHIHHLPIHSTLPINKLVLAGFFFILSSIGFHKKTDQFSKQSIASHIIENKNNAKSVKLDRIQIDPKKDQAPLVVISKLKAPIPPPIPFKDEEYKAVVSSTVNWIKAREDQYQMVNYSKTRDSLEFEVAEKLLLRSLLQNYQLRKELLNAKLANIESEKEALDYLEKSKEWQEVLQYENWASTFLKRHPELSRLDSLRRF